MDNLIKQNIKVDMILCDLPYGTTKNKWDIIISFQELWNKYNKLIKTNGAIVLHGDGIFTAKLILSNEKYYRYSLVWNKKRGCDFLNANRKPLKSHEDICIFYKKQPTYNKQYWYAKPYKRTKNGSLSNNYGNRKEAWSESEDGKRNPLTILDFACEWLIKTYTNKKELILDNCMGSGSTIIAAHNLNRNYIGIDNGYCENKKSKYLGWKWTDVVQDRLIQNKFIVSSENKK